MKPTDFTVRRVLRPSVFVPVVVVVCAALPAFLAGGCGSSSSSTNDTSEFTSIPTTPVSLTVDWAVLTTSPTPTPSPTASATPTPNPSATPTYSETDLSASGSGLAAPQNALSAVITLSSADPSNGSVLIFPAINRDDAKPLAYSATYVSALKARTGATNANVRFYDSKNGLGNALADYTKLSLTIHSDGTGLNAGLPTVSTMPSPTPTPSPSASP